MEVGVFFLILSDIGVGVVFVVWVVVLVLLVFMDDVDFVFVFYVVDFVIENVVVVVWGIEEEDEVGFFLYFYNFLSGIDWLMV